MLARFFLGSVKISRGDLKNLMDPWKVKLFNTRSIQTLPKKLFTNFVSLGGDMKWLHNIDEDPNQHLTSESSKHFVALPEARFLNIFKSIS